MTLIQFEVLLTVVKEGSFTKAGDVLGMTQSAVSHIISNLESELGVTLLIRDRRGIKLTAAGEKVVNHVEQIIQHVDLLQSDLLAYKGLAKGTIRIGSFPSVSAHLLPLAMKTFRASYPEIELIFLDGTNQEVRNWLFTGAIDVGFVSLPDSEFETTFIVHDEMKVLVPSTHSLASKRSLEVEDIRDEAFIMTKGGCEGMIRKIFKACNPDIKYEVKETSTILTMVQQGFGITILPSMALPAKLPQAVVLSFDPPVYRSLGLAVNSLDASSKAVQMFIEHVHNLCKTDLP
ncbi:LysR family transcriptional regulator [Brevibacillus ginsengisoli]|uniref:LysR family transcriptional regulator n=1 Tax=Brevibacillus ginsengisoli TaxID=363854 RepID=UPI003CEFB236